MPLTRFAFIVKAPGYFSNKHKAELTSTQFITHVVGVSDLASAIEVTQQLILKGTQLIELCGGFTEEDAFEIRTKTHNKIPIGVVVYRAEQAKELERLFSADNSIA